MKLSSKIILIIFVHLFIILLAFLPTLIVTFGKLQPYQRGFYCDDESIRYPFKTGSVSFIVVGVVGVGVTLIVIVVTEIIYSKKTLSQRSIIYSPVPEVVINIYKFCGIFIFGAAFDQMITNSSKYLVGRLRPHFINACNLDFSKVDCLKYNYVMIEDSFCNQTDLYTLKDMRLSFPSGHSSFSAYCAIAFSIYLMKRWNRLGPLVAIRSLCQAFFILLAILCALSRISDYKHHWSDVLAGFTSGTLVAIVVWCYLLHIRISPKAVSIEGYKPSSNGETTDII